MQQSCTIALETSPRPDDTQAVRDGLAAYNESRAGATGFEPLTIFLRGPDGAIAGGLLGGTYWGWLFIEILWVAERRRGRGHGRSMLVMAEREAVRRGCHHAHLDTMSYQARPFYEREGYAVFGELRDIPTGHSRYFMQKALPTGPRG